MAGRLSYTDALDAIGLYVERADGVDLFVNEIDAGFLVSFLAGDEQRVTTLDTDELTRLRAEGARRHGLGDLFRRRGGKQSSRALLRGVGRHLDGQVMATAVVVQERADGYSVEYTGLVNPKDDLTGIMRIHEELDDARAQALSR